MRTLRRGDRGEDVKMLQRALTRAGFYSGRIDGIFGPQTLAAVQAFQRANDLRVDGIVGPLTWNALAQFLVPEATWLRRGDRGPYVEILQLALTRAGFSPGVIDGVFGPQTDAAVRRFQRANGLTVDGIAGTNTLSALMPYILGYTNYTVQRGDTLFRIARRFNTSVAAIVAANGIEDPSLIFPGEDFIVPFGFDVVPTNISYTSELVELIIDGLDARYPFINRAVIGQSVSGTPIEALTIGSGTNNVFYNASHHANEWITTPLLLKFLEQYAKAYLQMGRIGSYDARQLFEDTKLHIVPLVNPDGVDLVTGGITEGALYDTAVEYAENYPNIPFPSGWKANIRGVDLNVNYPADWTLARQIKFAQGFTLPGPRDFVGTAPLSEPESRAVYDYTRANDFLLTLSYHTQGKEIYWTFRDIQPPRGEEIGRQMAAASGYALLPNPENSYAGYKDWFLSEYNKPGYTVEAGIGTNPLPLSQFDTIYNDNLNILAIGMGAFSE